MSRVGAETQQIRFLVNWALLCDDDCHGLINVSLCAKLGGTFSQMCHSFTLSNHSLWSLSFYHKFLFSCHISTFWLSMYVEKVVLRLSSFEIFLCYWPTYEKFLLEGHQRQYKFLLGHHFGEMILAYTGPGNVQSSLLQMSR